MVSKLPPVAVVGVSALFPGSPEAERFWRNIVDGVDLFSEVPESHWGIDDYYDPSEVKLPSNPVIVLDAVNPENNITATWTTTFRDNFLDKAQQAYNAMLAARSAELDEDEDEAFLLGNRRSQGRQLVTSRGVR